jgi:hypothetical protein
VLQCLQIGVSWAVSAAAQEHQAGPVLPHRSGVTARARQRECRPPGLPHGSLGTVARGNGIWQTYVDAREQGVISPPASPGNAGGRFIRVAPAVALAQGTDKTSISHAIA